LTRDFADHVALYVPATAGGRCNDEPAEERAEHGGHGRGDRGDHADQSATRREYLIRPGTRAAPARRRAGPRGRRGGRRGHVAAVAQLQGLHHALLDEEDGQPALAPDAVDRLEDLLDDARAEPLRGLVQEREVGLGFLLGLVEPGGTHVRASRTIVGAQPFAAFREAIDALLAEDPR
jgi:hypothetical protein